MAGTTDLGDRSAHSDARPVPPAKGLKMQILKPRYSVLDVGLTIVLVSLIFAAISGYRISEHAHALDAMMSESPLPDVRLAEMRTIPDPIAYKHAYIFTTNWFTRNIPVWEKALSSFRGKADVQYLEVGAFEGRSALWTLENILTDPTAHATCIDVFDGPYRTTFFANLERSGQSGKVTAIADYSQIALRKMPLDHFDIIYIDGSHSKEDVLEDAVLSWRLLKEGGVMIFDDYQWVGLLASGTSDAPTDICKTAIDRFVQCFDEQIEVIHNSYQVILKKTPQKRRRSPVNGGLLGSLGPSRHGFPDRRS